MGVGARAFRLPLGLGALLLATACGRTGILDAGALPPITDTVAPGTPSATAGRGVAPSVPQEAYARPTDPSTPIDVPTAERVFRALYPLRTQAVHEHRAAVLAAIETDPLRAYELAQCKSRCEEPPAVGPDVPHTFSAPPQTGYPAFFFARANRTQINGDPFDELTVFSRASAADPWRLALGVGMGPTLPVLADASAGFGQPPPRMPGPDPGALPAALAAYWQHWLDHGSAPPDSPFVVVDYVEQRGADIAASQVKNAKLGEREVRTYQAEPSVFTASADRNRTVACGVVRLEAHHTPLPGHGPLVQSPSRVEWGRDLAPGTYREVIRKGLEQDCFLIPGDGRSLPFYGNGQVTTSLTGIPA